MTMNPEYNYGFKKTYTVHIDNRPSKFNIVRKIIEWMQYRIRGYHDSKNKYFRGLTAEEFASLQSLLKKSHSYEVCENHIYTAFYNEILMADFPKRHPHRLSKTHPEHVKKHHLDLAQFGNDWYSHQLSKMNEYSFQLWVETEKLDEAYRLTILPSFEDSRVIRIWQKDDAIHLIYKIGSKEYDCEPELKYQYKAKLTGESLRQLQEFMTQHFWNAESWYTCYGYGVLDGVKYLFEGWRNGEYKLLDDHSPRDENSLSSQAVRLFQSLIEVDDG